MSSLQALEAASLTAHSATGSFRTRDFGPAREPRGPRGRSRGERRPLAAVRRLVVKLGTRVLVDETGAARLERLESLARSIAALRAGGLEVIVVSSGAVGLGTGLLGLSGAPADVEARRACAAVGQARLLALYQSAFAVHGLMTAQVLVTCADLHEGRKAHLRATFERLLAAGVVPVVNENDAISLGVEVHGPTPGLTAIFRDNDGLAAHVAAGCEADLLLLLTDVDGVCARDPRRFPGEPVLERVDDAEALLDALLQATEFQSTEIQSTDACQAPGASLSRGGMHSKVAAALLACRGACDVVIASGNAPGTLEETVAGEVVGTFFPRQARSSSPQTTQTAQTTQEAP